MEEQLFSRFERLFWQLSRKMGYIWNEIFEQRFPGSQSYILFILDESGPKKMSELAQSICLTPGAVTVATDKLIKQGYIERIRDEEDRRIVHVKISDKGKEMLQDMRNEGKEAMRNVFSHLSEPDLQHMVEIFEQASRNLENKGEERLGDSPN